MLKCCERNPSDYQLVAYQGHVSNLCSKELMKTHKIVVAVMGTIVGSTALAILCFDKKAAIGGALNPRVYDYINVGLSGSFLLSAVMLPQRKLQDTKEAGVCSYEFLATAMFVQTVMYSVVFFNTQDQTDVDRSVMFGFSLAMVSTSAVIAALKHYKALDLPRRPSDLEEKLFLEVRGSLVLD